MSNQTSSSTRFCLKLLYGHARVKENRRQRKSSSSKHSCPHAENNVKSNRSTVKRHRPTHRLAEKSRTYASFGTQRKTSLLPSRLRGIHFDISVVGLVNGESHRRASRIVPRRVGSRIRWDPNDSVSITTPNRDVPLQIDLWATRRHRVNYISRGCFQGSSVCFKGSLVSRCDGSRWLRFPLPSRAIGKNHVHCIRRSVFHCTLHRKGNGGRQQ